MKFTKVLVVWFCLMINGVVFAAGSDPAPLAMLKGVWYEMKGELDKNIGHLKNNYRLINSLVNRIVVPHFDVTRMSRTVVGRYWQSASTSTQQEFVKQFTNYVIRTYSSAIQSYDGENMKFYPIRGGVREKVRVSSDLILKNSPPIQLQYGLSNQGGQWLVYDFSVDGVSIVKNYQSQFANILRQKGLDGLVKDLQRKNVRR